MREKLNTVIFVALFLAICIAVLFGEQIVEAVNTMMTEQAESLVDQLLR